MFMETVFKVFVKNVRARMKFNWDLVDPLKTSKYYQEYLDLLQSGFYATAFYAYAFNTDAFLCSWDRWEALTTIALGGGQTHRHTERPCDLKNESA